MTKSKSKFKGIFKGAALGFALVLCGAFFPFNAAVALAENWQGSDATNNTSRISVGAVDENEAPKTVAKGDTYTIPQGVYSNGGTDHVIGTNVSGSISSSKVEVLYKNTNDVVVKAISGQASFANQTFDADRIGTYTIRYTVVVGTGENAIEYSYDYDVQCVANEASFEFRANSSNIVPTIYDKELAQGKDIVIPLPNVTDEDGETILSVEDGIEYYTNSMDSRPSYESEKKAFVLITLTGGNETEGEFDVKLEKNTEGDGYFISGEDLSLQDDGSEFKLTYSYYELRENNQTPVFIASTSTTFTVEDEYYFTDSDRNENGYSLTTSWSTSRPDSAVVGVAVDLPSITATTRSTNAPASEAVSVYYELQVMKYNEDTGRYDIDVTSGENGTYDAVENTFTAKEEGSYRFIYTVYDFYGNTVDSSNTTFTINNVRDTQQANVYVYDAGDYTVEDGVYSDASYKIKTQGLTRNVIMYAIAGKDNMVDASEISLRREIRDASAVRFSVTEEKYNAYNLIFAPSTTTTGGDSPVTTIDYVQIASDNYEISRQMIIDAKEDPSIDPSNAESVKNWLLENNYLLVTTYWNQDPAGDNILEAEDEGYSETVGDQDAISAMIEKGFAYVPAETTNGHYNFVEGTRYSFYYYANDNMNNNTERAVYYTSTLNLEYEDTALPTINFSTDLQTSYLPTDTITFDVATASDSVDARLDVLTAYRFLNSTGDTVTNEDTNKTLQYLIYNNSVNNSTYRNSDKWYVTEKDDNGLVTSEGWYFDKNESSYTIDLSKAPSDAQKVEILVYAIDDGGNISFYYRTINIASTADEDAPVLTKVDNAPATDLDSQDYVAPQTIVLPTLEFTATNPQYMYARVDVYRVTTTTGDNGTITTRQIMQSSNMSTSVDTYRGVFRVKAGTFNASTGGDYQVAVTVVDSSNQTVSTYFNYRVEETGVVENPEITNISSTPIEAAVDTPYYLAPPTLSVSSSTSFGYIGLDINDDSNTSTYYTTTMVEASHNDYELTQQWFTGVSKGTYKLQYNVFLMRYRISDLLEDGATSQDAGIFLENGKLMYKEAGASATKYFIYFEETDNGYEVAMNTMIDGLGDAPELDEGQTVEDLLSGLVDVFVLPSNIQTITVGDIGINISIDGSAYERTQYPTVGNTITIVKPDIDIQGNGEVNLEESFVQINCTTETTRSIGTIYFDEWEDSVVNDSDNFEVNQETGEIKLKLVRNGQYTIRYSVQVKDSGGQNVGDPRTLEYTISNGDVRDPEVTLEDNFVNANYKLGDTLVIDIDKITVEDNVTIDRDTLLSTIQITLTNNDTGDSERIDNTGAEGYYQFQKELTEVGNYTLTITVADKAGNRNDGTSVSFDVTADGSDPVNVQEVLGGVLIGLSVAVLAGVVIYFVVSKVKLDKRAKGYSQDIKNDKNKK